VNHQLQPNAADTESFCLALCQSLDIPCHTTRVTVDFKDATAATGGLEEAARKARYGAFKSCLGQGDLLVMAHHGDDQTETVLFRMLRGTGVSGLAGMPVSRPLGKGTLYRPFLEFSRRQLEAWARECDLSWVEDPSNTDQRFDRNFLRQSIIPALKERWPFLNRRLAATASACRESSELADSLAAIHLDRCGNTDGSLDLNGLAQLTLAEQKNLVRWWVRGQGYPAPETADWQGLLAGFIEAPADRQPEFRGAGYRLLRHHDSLCLVKEIADVPEQPRSLEAGKKIAWGGWQLTLEPVSADEGRVPELVVHGRQGGERIRVSPGGPSRPLKKWLQEQSVPVWKRGGLPLVTECAGGARTLVAAGNLWVCERYCGEAPASGWRLIMERDSD
jgi:tRNA(Ile)-lysidine synthase